MSRFRRNMEELLEEWRPRDGMAALLLEHPTQGIYFPLVVKPSSVGTDYYSLPLRFIGGCEPSIRLDERSSPERLAFRGRLELMQPDLRLPVHQELFPLHEDEAEGSVKVLLLRSSPRELPELDTRNFNILKSLVPLTCLNWIEQAQDLVEIPEYRDFDALAKDLVKRLSDEEQDPPYFPILHAEVSPDPEDVGTRFASANVLSWNCFLLHNQQGTPAYVSEMSSVMLDKKIHDWWEDLTRRDDFPGMSESIRKACAKTVDHVRLLGRCEHQGTAWWAFARHNKDRSKMAGLLTEWPRDEPVLVAAEAWRELESQSPGDLVRHALAINPDDDDVLVTVWLVSDAGQGINIGFKAGRRIEVLDHTEITDRDYIEIADYAPFKVRLLPLPLVNRRLIEERVRPILASAAKAARRIDGAGLIEQAFAPVRREIHEGSWHDDHSGQGLFVDRYHDVADWPEADLARCHAGMVTMLEDLLSAWTGRDKVRSPGECKNRQKCWHIRALKALAHDRLYSSLLMTVLGGPVDDASFLLADREICLQENMRWPEVLAALQTVTTEGNRFQFGQCFHGKEQTLILRFSGQLNEQGVAAALTGQGTGKRKGSFTRACEALRRASLRFGVEVTHEEPGEERWGIVVVFDQREIPC